MPPASAFIVRVALKMGLIAGKLPLETMPAAAGVTAVAKCRLLLPQIPA